MKCLFALILACCAVCAFNSCGNKRQEKILLETAKRLEQQNDYFNNRNHFLRGRFDELFFDEYSDERFQYFKAYTNSFYQNIDLLYAEVNMVRTQGKKSDKIKIYQHFAAFQASYLQLKKCLADSFQHKPIAEHIDSFMTVDAKGFIQEYIRSQDSFNLRIELLNLQSDIAFFETSFLENLIDCMTPRLSCRAMALRAMAFTKKNLYKKGDKLEVTAMLGNYIRGKNGQAQVEGQVIKEDQGVYYYSRSITEKPGTYTCRFVITINQNGMKMNYPAEVSYLVE